MPSMQRIRKMFVAQVGARLDNAMHARIGTTLQSQLEKFLGARADYQPMVLPWLICGEHPTTSMTASHAIVTGGVGDVAVLFRMTGKSLPFGVEGIAVDAKQIQ